MKIPFFEKEEGNMQKISISIQADLIYGCLFKIEKDNISVFALYEEEYDGENFLEKLITVCRKLSSDAKHIPLDVIFGLPEETIVEEKIETHYEEKLQEASKILHLNPVAFVSNAKAFSFLLEKEEGSRPNVIAIGLGKKRHSIFLFQEGEYRKTSHTTSNQIEELVAKIKSLGENLPSRIVLFGASHPESFYENLRSRISEESHGVFVQTPKIEVLPKDVPCLSVALATAYDLGYLPQSKPEEQKDLLKEEKKRDGEGHFGFVHGKDILAGETPPPILAEEQKTTEEPLREGFSLGAFALKFSQIPFTIFSGKRKRRIIFFAFFIIFLVGAFSLWWFLPSSEITLKVRSQVLEKEEDILVPNDSSGQIAGTIVETNLQDNKKAVATGKKEVGEKSKGEVTIFNKTSQPRTFSGTILKSTSGVVFELDSSVTVASRSATLEGITYGRAKTNVTAKEIGPEGNAPADTNFTIADFDQSLYSAYNDQAFSGGTKREVSVVSEEDRKRLQEAQIQELLARAKEELKGKIPQDARLEEQAIKSEVKSQKFDKEVGQEATAFSLTQEIRFFTVAYKQEDLFKILSGKMESDIPEGYEIVPEFSTVEVLGTQDKENGILLKTKFKGALIPKFDFQKIIKELVGKSPKITKDYLLTLPDVQEAQIAINPQMPPFLITMPHVASRISIRVNP